MDLSSEANLGFRWRPKLWELAGEGRRITGYNQKQQFPTGSPSLRRQDPAAKVLADIEPSLETWQNESGPMRERLLEELTRPSV